MPQSYKGWTTEKLARFEHEIAELFLAKKILAPIHLSGGNEQVLIDLFAENNIDEHSWCFSTHRSHFHALLKGISPKWLKQEILEGRSIGIFNKEHNFFSSAIVGGCLPIALGVALAIKRKDEQRHVWCFVGDMAAETGIFYECTKYAKNFDLPITFVVECNARSVNTPTYIVWASYHKHNVGGPCKTLKAWTSGRVLSYCTNPILPHSGTGVWLKF